MRGAKKKNFPSSIHLTLLSLNTVAQCGTHDAAASPRVLGGGDSVGPSAGGSPRDGRGAETRGHLLCYLRWAPFSRRGPWSGSCPAGPSPRQAGLQLQESLEPAVRLDRYPRAEMIVWVLVLEDRGSALPAAVSCASLPLADTGIEMFNLALGCGLSRGPGGELLLDPDDDEEEAGSGGTMSLSLLPTLNQVSAWACGDYTIKICCSLGGCHAIDLRGQLSRPF
uniref:Exoribonuclease phosphorolytic domain-containing protein n=1 Tax=Xenopus tropicalis TaxID=8364 RepID=A0A803JTZ3_XENTR